jgi:drug/metabolite transporter (DMT)-like permease
MMLARKNMIVYALLLIAICLTVTGEVLLKLGMNTVRVDVGAFSASLPVLLRTFTEWRVVLGFTLIFSGALFWLGVISRADFSFAYPLLALSYIVALFPARFVLGEQVTPHRIIGALIVVAGALIIGWEQK